MNIRKLLDWRKLLIYSHRWLGIAMILMFIVWFVSGAVLMYYGMPHLTGGERLMRMTKLDLSTVRITPADAAGLAKMTPTRLRISMHENRPVYRFSRSSSMIGPWQVVYADTGELLGDLGPEEAMGLLRSFVPEHASNLRYGAYLTSPDEFTRIPFLAGFLPMHRIAMGDAAGTEYYVSEKSGETVLKTDRIGRILGFSGYVLHNLFFFRQQPWWNGLMYWLSVMGIAMCLSGLVAGIWRFGLSARFRHKGVRSHSPYSGWMKWHHYAGLIFGLVTFTWIFSGAVVVPAIPWVGDASKRPSRMADGFIVSSPLVSRGTSMTEAQIRAMTGGPLDLKHLTIDRLQKSAAAIAASFSPKEIELLQFRGDPYFIAYKPPASPQELDRWLSRTATNFLAIATENEHAMVSAMTPEQGVFKRFSDDVMMEIAHEAMPGIPMLDAIWLQEYDSYYYQTVSSFELGLPKAAYTLPVLRARYDDPNQTWLYLTPSHGQMLKYEVKDRANRWAYHGLHALDFSFLYNRRPLWDIVVLALLVGGTVLSVTTLLPAFRRLKRHSAHIATSVTGRRKSRREPVRQVAMSGVDTGKRP